MKKGFWRKALTILGWTGLIGCLATATFSWFAVNNNVSPSTSVATNGMHTDAFVYNKNRTHTNDDAANRAATGDEGGTLPYDHSKEGAPVDWYVVLKHGEGSLNAANSIQMYENRNNHGDIAAYYHIKFEIGDRFKIASGSREHWLGYESLSSGSAFYSNFTGESDEGEQKIRCTTACVADIFVNDTYKIYIMTHGAADEEPSLGKGAGFYIVGDSSVSGSLFKDADYEISKGFVMNYDTHVQSKSAEAGYYGLRLHNGDHIIIWDGNGTYGWYGWSNVNNAGAKSCFAQGNQLDKNGSPYDFVCNQEGYYDFYIFGGLSGLIYTHNITIERHVEGADSSGQSGNALAARRPETFGGKKEAASVTSATGYIRIYFNASGWSVTGGRVGTSDLQNNWASATEMTQCSSWASSLTAASYSTASTMWYVDIASSSASQTLYFCFYESNVHWYRTDTGYQGTLGTSFATGYIYLLSPGTYRGESGTNKWCDINESKIGAFAGFNGDGGTVPGNYSYAEATAASGTTYTMTTLAAPTKTYYTFSKWKNMTSNAEVSASTSTTITAPTVFKALWAIKTYTATISVYEGSTKLGSSFTATSLRADTNYYPSYTVSELFTKASYAGTAANYRVDGYFTSTTFTASNVYSSKKPTANFNLYAKVGPADQGFSEVVDSENKGDQVANYYLIGQSFTSGSDLYNAYWRFDSAVRFVQHASDKGVVYVTLKAGDQFKIRAGDSDTWYTWANRDTSSYTNSALSSFEAGTSGNATDNIKCKTNGTYAIFLSSSSKIYFFSMSAKPGYYLRDNSSGSWSDTAYRYTSGVLKTVAFDANECFLVRYVVWNDSTNSIDTYWCRSPGATTSGTTIKSSKEGDGASGFGNGSASDWNFTCSTAGTYQISASATTSPSATITIRKSYGALSDGFYLVGENLSVNSTPISSWTPTSTLYSSTLTATFSNVVATALTSQMKVYELSGGYVSNIYGWTASSNSTYLVSNNGSAGANVEFRYGGTYTITFDSSHNFGITSAVLSSDSFRFNNTASTFTRDASSTTTRNVFKYTTVLTVGGTFQVDAAANDTYAYGHWGWNNLASACRADFYASNTSVDSTNSPSNYKIASRYHHSKAVITFVLEDPSASAISVAYAGDDDTSYSATNLDNPTGIYFVWGHSKDDPYNSLSSATNKARMSYDLDERHNYKYDNSDWATANPFNVDKKATVKVTLNTASYCSVIHNLDSFASLHDILNYPLHYDNGSGGRGDTYLDASAGTEHSNTFYLPAGHYIIYLLGQDGTSPFYPTIGSTTYRVLAKAVTTTVDTSDIHEVPYYAAGRGMPGSALVNGDYTTTKSGSTYRYIPFWAAANQTSNLPSYASASKSANNGITLKAGDHFVLTDGAITTTTFTNSAEGTTSTIAVVGSEIVVKRGGVFKITATKTNAGIDDDSIANATFTITTTSLETETRSGNDVTLEGYDANPAAYSKQHGVRVLNANGSTIKFGASLDNSLLDGGDGYLYFIIELRHINTSRAGKLSAAFAAALPSGAEYRMTYVTQDNAGTDVSALDSIATSGSFVSTQAIFADQDIGINTAANHTYDTCYAAATLLEVRIPYSAFTPSNDRATYSWAFAINITFKETTA